MGEMVTFPSNGGSVSGYLARPKTPGPGIVVIQEWWGLVPHIKDVCDRLALEGFTALAPDLYHGRETKEPDEAGKLMMSLSIDTATKDMSGAVDFLLKETGRPTVGVTGFCMGGGLALFLAALRPEVAACVPFYGVGPAVEKADFSKTKAAFLGHWGGNDPSTPRPKIGELEEKLRGFGHEVTMHWYEGCDHAFFNDQRPEVYNPDAAQLAWERTLGFFRSHLGSPVGTGA